MSASLRLSHLCIELAGSLSLPKHCYGWLGSRTLAAGEGADVMKPSPGRDSYGFLWVPGGAVHDFGQSELKSQIFIDTQQLNLL